ncbi:MAG: hypothetical protein E6Q95_06385 [Chitinophagaceae bacterium]|nr:MAG: hypothetical protein E6Q95_06385 [Chitinophagaceae bacterium]
MNYIKGIFLLLVLCSSSFLVAQSIKKSAIETDFINGLKQTSQTKEIALGKTIYQGVFTGNGLIGSMTFLKDSQSVKINIGRTDIYDRREGKDNLFERPRLPLGYFEIKLSEKIIEATGKIDIYNAQAIADFKTEKGNLFIKSISFAEENYILIELDDKNYNGKYEVLWRPEVSESPRMHFSYTKKPDDYQPNPQVIVKEQKGILTSYQAMSAGGNYSVGKLQKKIENKTYLLIHIDYQTGNISSRNHVIQALQNFNWSQLATKVKKHQQWWHQYYALSSLNIPDVELQNFYNYQLYKLASATRSNKPAIDLQGPWTDNTPWPGYWFNLNIQLTYSPLYTANRLSLAESLIKMIDKNKNNLSKNVPAPYQYNSIAVGRSGAPDMLKSVHLLKSDTSRVADGDAELSNLTWILYYYYQHYDVTRDENLKVKLFDLLKKSISFYLHLIEKNKFGKYQIAVRTYSPEYPNGYGYNTNYDLSVLKWGLKTLIALDKASSINDALLPRWKDVYENLIEYPKDANGFLIAENIPYEVSHRHYSHLMMIYPFYDINWGQLENQKLIETSIHTWQSKPQALQGYSLTGHASMKAMMSRGDEARDILKSFIKKFVKPNTLYAESGPVIETPLADMQSIQELYIQNWNDGMIRVFPAIPSDWKNTSFENLRVSGAFLISGKRENGKNKQLTIYSEKGGEITVKPNLDGFVNISGGGKLLVQDNDIYTFEIPKGRTIKMMAQ